MEASLCREKRERLLASELMFTVSQIEEVQVTEQILLASVIATKMHDKIV